MTKNKTTENDLPVEDYINAIADEGRREDIKKLVDIFEKTSGFLPKMWGTAIIGFGNYHYKYESGREGDMPLVGLSSRVAQISLYMHPDFDNKVKLLSELGKYKTTKACIYVKKLSDINPEILKKIIINSIKKNKEIYG